SAGEWIYSGCFSEGHNLTKRQNDKYDPQKKGLYPKWAFSWPGNVRVLYNRASCDLEGKPRDPERALIWWDAAAGKWTGVDKPDVKGITSAPSSEKGLVAFKMTAEGNGRIFTAPYHSTKDNAVWAKSGANMDGPIPEFYEPIESPSENLLHPKVSTNPVVIYPRLKN
ncbi:MAG: formate dehydrogenase, partial [Bacteroidetes bacterium]|nr:formate dehydrogenase [Bacteroidota bacterium]